jgi:PAS domain-containing protein/HPt (histidine-containing phosphotransfer) domain-containing protein
LGGLLTALLIAFFLQRASSAVAELERGNYSQLATDARVRFDRLASRDRSRLIEAAFSDELYALIQKGPAAPDSFVRPAFAARFGGQFGDRLVALYGLSGRPLFLAADPAVSGLARAVANNALFRMLDNREPTVGLVRAGPDLYWVGGAPILPTNYADATQPIRGYLVVAQPFTPSSLSPGAGERAGRMELSELRTTSSPFRTRVESSAGDSVRIEFALTDIFAQQTTLATLVTSRAEFRRVEGTLRTLTLLGVLFAAVLAAAGWFVASRTLVTPAVKMSAALAPVHSGQVPSLITASSAAAEWSMLTGAVNRLLANGRVAAERFDRMTGVVAEGAWERDLNSGDWIATPRFRRMLGFAESDQVTPLAALEQRLHPEDRDRVVSWLTADQPTPRTFAGQVRIVRPTGEEGWCRFEASVATDLGGTPIRVTGRLVDLSQERAAAIRIQDAEASAATASRAQGELLIGLAANIATADAGVLVRQLEWIGQGMTGTIAVNPAPFDLHSFLQEIGAESGLETELTLLPGVPSQVIGDRRLAGEVLRYFVEQAGPAEPLIIRAEQPDRTEPEVVRLVVENRGSADDATIARRRQTLETGQSAGADLQLGWRMVHHLVRSLGGYASAEREGPITRTWFQVRLPGVAAPAAAAPVDFGSAGKPSWEEAPNPDATFGELSPNGARPSGPAPRPSGPVELVADATVTIRFDEAPVALPPIGDRVRSALAAQESGAVRTARIALEDTPIRLTELRGAVRAGEARTVANIAQAIRAIADALEARRMGARCGDILDAVESQYLETADELVTALDQAWSEVRSAIEPYGQGAADPVGIAADTIEADALEQLAATITADGLGLGNQLVSLFLAEAPARVEAAERAAERGDLAALRGSVTDLKGMCGLVGAKALAAQCAVIAAQPDLTIAGAQLGQLRAQYRSVQEALEPLLGVRAGA